ncbi:hypothetical protein CISG_00615 [Coccidioides immitis RMSCC 3703]|uniref:Phosphatidylinositol transfer protein SFH5 n=1 Tax=Coccidioides immitis RMSCC 3703 TaxID=454286 RepID=A0A0J8QRG3_COCIT|nr:hypothetical protein CISG_00615 [Coccidioides immitis RMSCC 3703]
MEKVQEQPAQTLSETAEQPAERVVEQPQDSAATAAPPGDSKEAETEKPAEVAPKEDSKEAPAPPPAATTAATADDANSDIIEESKTKPARIPNFIRMNPNIRAASRETIEVFSTAYPELLKEKYFVNLPVVMGWVFTALKVFLSKNTIRKFHPITNGVNLAREFTTFGEEIPKTYGGKGDVLADSGRTVTLQDDKAPETKPEENGNASQAPEAEPASGNPAQTDATNGPAKDDAPKNDKPAVPTDTKTDAPADAPANTLADAPADSRAN